MRKEQGYERWVEWWQWLADRLEEQASLEEIEPAYRRLPAWKPH